jgi:aryl-alcohol dehydrogenase-like predicted oxidoreductase
MKRQVEDSLRHLDIPRIFLEQLHCIPTEEMRAGKVFDHLRLLQEEGLISHFGASVETSEEALICLEQEGLASLQVIFNLFRQHVADEVFAKAAEKGVAIIVRVPLASGLLSGKFNAETQFAQNDHRNYNGEAVMYIMKITYWVMAKFTTGVSRVSKLCQLRPVSTQPMAKLRGNLYIAMTMKLYSLAISAISCAIIIPGWNKPLPIG